MDDGRANQPRPPAPAGPATGPVIVWLLIQLVALSLAALRVPLAAKYPRPEEVLAPHVLLAIQLAASALLFPYLLQNAWTSLAVIAAAWPFAAAACVLSGVAPARAAAGEAYVCAWLLTLALWRPALSTSQARLYGIGIASAVAIGWVALGYLAAEFRANAEAVGESGGPLRALGPVGAALRQLSQERLFARDWLFPTAAAGLGLAVATWGRSVGRARLSTNSAPRPPGERPITS